MKKSIIAIMLLLALFAAANVCMAETESETEYEWVQVSDGVSPFVYSDSLLMVDENKMDPDIAKISAALAVAAYEEGTSKAILDKMGFDFLLQSNYGYTYTREDCHHVAYNIASKAINDYAIYCVTVRGTTDDLEWFSNFKSDTETDEGITYYKPFFDSAKEIEQDLSSMILQDGCSPDKRIIWLTGHSRGAAVTNIIAGRLTAGNRGHVFGYNFACPAVYLGNAPKYKNIYNFNFRNDFVPRVPLTSWGYTRYGEDKEVAFEDWFSDYALAPESIDAIIGFLATIEPDSETAKTVFALVDCVMSGEFADASIIDLVQIEETLKRYEVDPAGLCYMMKEGIYSQEASDNLKRECSVMIEFWNSNREAMASLPAEEWSEYRSKEGNSDVFAMYDVVAGEPVRSYAQLEEIIPTIISRNEAANTVVSLKTVFLDHIFNEKWGAVKGFGTPHNRINYLKWMNRKFYGYQGETGRNYEDVILLIDTKTISPNCFDGVTGDFEIILDNVQAIGREAFANCGGLSEVDIPENVRYAGGFAFENCKNLKTVTMPCDLTYRDFFEGCPVETLTYTPGSTGIVPDRTSYTTAADWMPEYDVRNTLKNLVFEEGITHIGSDLLYYDGNGGSGHSTSPAVCGAYLENVSLPSTLKTIGDRSFMGSAILNRVELPEGLESIGKSSFASCGLVEISFPSTLTAIPDGAFANCDLLTQVTVPDTITSVGKNAFADSGALWKITLTANATFNDSFEGCPVETIVYTPGDTGVIADRTKTTDHAHYWYTSRHMPELDVRDTLKEIVFEEGITHIGSYLCCNRELADPGKDVSESCTSLLRVSLPTTLKSIGEYSFYGCTALGELIFFEGLESIGEYSFSGCTALPGMVLPDSITTIGQHCFSGCESMASIGIPSSLTAIPNDAFNGTGLPGVIIPKNVTTVGSGAFSNCRNLKRITLSTNADCSDSFENSPVETIVYTPGDTGVIADRTKTIDHAHYWYTSRRKPELNVRGTLREIIFEEGITHIGSYLCCNQELADPGKDISESCEKLERITLPSTLESIGSYSFNGCSALNNVVLPAGLKYIGEYAFSGCDALGDITLPDALEMLGTYSFSASSVNISGSLPSALKTIPDYAFYGSGELVEVVIPENVTGVGYMAFGNCPNLKKVTLAANISSYNDSFEGSPVETIVYTPGSTGVIADRKKITDYSGKYYISRHMPELDARNTLKEIVFEEGITHIGSYLCCNQEYTAQGNLSESCEKLERITLPSTLKSIGSYSFNGCGALNSVTFPEGLESIGEYSFSGCAALPGITLPDSLSAMGGNCFSGCSAMTSVNIPSSLAVIPVGAFSGTGLKELTIPDQVQNVESNAFGNCRNLKKLTLSADVSDYYNSFKGCPVETIIYTPGSTGVIADRPKRMGSYNHVYSSEYMPEMDVRATLGEIVFEEGITHIGDYLCCNVGYHSYGYYIYDGCTNLRRITLPSTLESIGMYAFAYCDGLTDITFLNDADAPLTFYENAFYSSAWPTTYIRVPDTAGINPYLAGYSWSGAGRSVVFTVKLDAPFEIEPVSGKIVIAVPVAMSAAVIPKGYTAADIVWSVDDADTAQISAEGVITFERAGYITVKAAIPQMGIFAERLLECEGTQVILLPAMLTQVGQEAFAGISAEIIIVPETVERIEPLAFADCPDLYKVILRSPDTVIGDGAFEGSGDVAVVTEEWKSEG